MANWNEHVLNVRAGLDKASKEEMQRAVKDIFIEGAVVDFNNKENLKSLRELASVMEKIFAKAGNTKFDFTKMIELPGPEMFDELKKAAMEFDKVWSSISAKIGGVNKTGIEGLADGISHGISDGIVHGVADGVDAALKAAENKLNGLLQEQAQKMKQIEDLSDKQRKKEDMARRLDFDNAFNVESKITYSSDADLKKKVREIESVYEDALIGLQDAIDAGKVTEPILEKFRDAAKEMLKVKNTISDLMNQQVKQVNKTSGGMMVESKYISKAESLFGEQFVERLFGYDEETLGAEIDQAMDFFTEYFDNYDIRQNISDIKKELVGINVEIDKITAQHPELVSRQSTAEAEERLQKIHDAYSRLFSSRGDTKGQLKERDLKHIENTLRYAGHGDKIKALPSDPTAEQLASYNKTTTEVRKKLEDAFRLYDESTNDSWEKRAQYLIKAVAEYESILNNPNADKNILDGYGDKYQALVGQVVAEREKLEAVVAMARGVTTVGATDNNTDPADAEAIARAAQLEAEAAEKKSREEEAAAKARAKSSYQSGGILDNPMFANMFKKADADTAKSGPDEVNDSLSEQNGLLENIQRLTTYIDEEYLSAGSHLSDFLDDLQSDSSELDGELKEILTTLNLIDEKGNLNFEIKRNGEAGGGTTHNGALIGSDFVLIERGDFEKVKNSCLPNATKDAAKNGVNVAEVLGYLPSKYNKGFFDIQGVAHGNNLFENGILSQDVVNATDEQLQQLVNAFIEARNYGFDIENGGSNVVYDKEKGFSFYDLDELSGDEKAYWDSLSESEKKLEAIGNLFALFSDLNRDHTNYDTDQNIGGFAERLKSIIENNGIVNPRDVDRSGRNYEDIFDDTFGGYDEDDYSDIISQLQAEANVRRQHTDAIQEQASAQEALNNVQNKDIDFDDDAETIAKENGALEDKLELLRDIAEQYGNNISQKQRDRFEELNQKDMNDGLTPKEDERYWELGEQIEEADSALEEFGQTYDKIIVKLENGKKIEILPDDKGLRTLAKIDEEYGETYNGIAIEDVVFERVRNEVVETEHAVDNLNESLTKTQQLTSGGNAGSGAGDSSFAELEAERTKAEFLQSENDALQKQLQESEAESHTKDNAIQALRQQLAEAKANEGGVSSEELEAAHKESERLSAENSRLQELNAELESDNRYYADAIYEEAARANAAEARVAELEQKTAGSFEGGKKQGVVNTEELKTLLSAITYNVKIAYDDNDKQANKIALDNSALEATLTKVFGNILNPETPQNATEQPQEHWALENTLQTVKGVLDNIHTNTTKIGAVGSSNVDAITGTALDGRLTEIKSVLESINQKIVDGGKIVNRDGAKQVYKESQKTPAQETSARSSLMKSLINDYKTMGKLAAQFASDENLETKAMLDNLKAEITRKRQSLQLSMDENKSLREKYSVAFSAEKRLLDAAKAQKEINAQNKADAKATETAWKKQVKDAQRATGINAATSAANAGDQTVLRAIGTEGVSKDIENKAKELSGYIKTLRTLRDEIDKKGEQASAEDRDDLSKQISEVKKLKAEVDSYLKIHEKYSGEGATQFNDVDTSNFGAVGTDQYWNSITAAIQKASTGRVAIKGMNADTGELSGTTKIAANTFAEWSATVDPVTGKLSMLRTGIKKTETLVESITRKTKEVFTYFSGSSIIFKAFNELKKGIQYVREIDDALVELRKVTDETQKTYDKFLQTAAKTGEKLGATISDVTRATATFAKLGYAMSDASAMAEAALVYKNVGDNISSAEDAADSIISTLKGFNKENLDAMSIVDRFNEVGNRFAITSQGIGEALKLSASALSEGGNTLDESIGIITAANEVVNDPSSVGTALKTLTLRLRGSKTELEEMGEDVSDMATTTSQLQAKLLALTGGKVDIMLDANTFKSSTQILREMSEAWGSMTDIQKASALELMGGKRQANVLSALIQNFDTAERAIEASANSAGK